MYTKYSSFYQKSCKTNLSLSKISESCHDKNMYLYINPSPNDYNIFNIDIRLDNTNFILLMLLSYLLNNHT